MIIEEHEPAVPAVRHHVLDIDDEAGWVQLDGESLHLRTDAWAPQNIPRADDLLSLVDGEHVIFDQGVVHQVWTEENSEGGKLRNGEIEVYADLGRS